MLVLTMGFGMISQAAIKITQSEKLLLAGTSGSVWKNEAKGTRQNSSIKDSLYSGIKRTGDVGYRYGNPVGGNKVYLTAYSGTLLGPSTKLKGTAMVK